MMIPKQPKNLTKTESLRIGILACGWEYDHRSTKYEFYRRLRSDGFPAAWLLLGKRGGLRSNDRGVLVGSNSLEDTLAIRAYEQLGREVHNSCFQGEETWSENKSIERYLELWRELSD